MLPQNSSTSSSRGFDWRDLWLTGAWVIAFLMLFELSVWFAFTHTRLAGSSLRTYLWYGTSYEWKLREMVNTPDLPSNSILYAGWTGDGRIQALDDDAEVAVYGMSFSANLSAAMRGLRPQLTQREVGGPGAGLSASFGYYELDRTVRKTRFGVIGVTSGGVPEVLLMNRGTLFSDAAFPYFYPRYEVAGDGVRRVATPLINSADELRAALKDPGLWQQQLSMLAAHDSAYHRFFFAHDVLDYSALGRFVRRGMAKREQAAFLNRVHGPGGFNRDNEAPRLFRALMRQMIRDLKAEHVQPVVVLFSLQGDGNHLYDLVSDILAEEGAPFVNTNDFCPSDSRDNYLRDRHFVPDCNRKFAQRTIEIMESLGAHTGAPEAKAP